jgi:UDP-2-acetamido-2-deoxy-ribo-hexuluronate aminotransferase
MANVLKANQMEFIDLRSQYNLLEADIHEGLLKVFSHGKYIMGPEVEQLENALAKFTGSKFCITVSSGTEALLISLMALGVGRGDEVITSSFTFAATAEVIALLGAQPVFADISLDTCNIEPESISRLITKKTKAIIPVSLYGQTSDMEAINLISEKYGSIPVIEDAAQSFGASYRGQKSCNLSTIGCTSFFPSKPLGCYGDGGAIFTNSLDFAEICRSLRVHGQQERYVHSRVGVGGRMDTIQCAITLAKLSRFNEEIRIRKEKGDLYNHLIDKLQIPRININPGNTSVYAQYTIFTENREELREILLRDGIPTSVHYPLSMTEQPAYKEFRSDDHVPNSVFASKKVLSLPMSAYIENSDIYKIVDILFRNKNLIMGI